MLRTGTVRRVLDADARVRVVILSPMAADAEFVREVMHPRVTVEALPPHSPAGIEARLLALMQAAYIDSGITESVRIRRVEAQATVTVPLPPKRLAPPSTTAAMADRLSAV